MHTPSIYVPPGFRIEYCVFTGWWAIVGSSKIRHLEHSEYRRMFADPEYAASMFKGVDQC